MSLLSWISDDDLRQCVAKAVKGYESFFKSIGLEKANKNIIDPIKLMFDHIVLDRTWEEVIKHELLRQRDKTTNNVIGHFHQSIFKYIKNCETPKKGWDVIFRKNDGILLPDGDKVKRVYVELKNKHNTINSSSGGKIYRKMQKQILDDDECACFLVEIIAKTSLNSKWETTIDKKKESHKRIRRVSVDFFYELVTGEKDAFNKLCINLPQVIKGIIEKRSNVTVEDSAFVELKKSAVIHDETENISQIMQALLLLAFRDYKGFS